MRLLDVPFHSEGCGLDGKVDAAFDTDGKVEGKEVVGKPASVVFGEVAGDDATHGRGDANGPEF